MVDTVSDVGDAIGGAVKDVATTAYDYGSSAASTVGGGGWSAALSTISFVEDISPDIPYVDVEVADGQLSAGVDVYGYGAGISVGEHGVSGQFDAGLISAEGGLTDQGWNFGMSMGDTGWPSYLPAMSFGVKGDYDGNVAAEFEGQGAIPIPGYGVVVAEAGGQFHRNSDGTWGVAGQVQGDYYGLDGTRAGGSLYGGYARTEDGSVVTAGGSGYIQTAGGLSASANVDYSRIQQGDDILESLDAGAQFKGYGFEGGGRMEYDRAVMDGNEVISFDAAGKVSGHGLEAAGTASYDELTTADGKTVSDWDTQYSVKGLDDLVGDTKIGAAADTLGIDLPKLDGSSGQSYAAIEQDVDSYIARNPTYESPEIPADVMQSFTAPVPEQATASVQSESDALEQSLDNLDDF